MSDNSKKFNFVDVNEAISKFPDKADTMIVDAYLNDQPSVSCRVFRLYQHLPKHYHKTCDETLYLLQGKAKFYIEDEPPRDIYPGMMVTFFKNTAHMVVTQSEDPVIFLSYDTPRRNPEDVHFINPEEAKGLKFASHIKVQSK